MEAGLWAVKKCETETISEPERLSKLPDSEFQMYVTLLYNFGGGDKAPSSLSELLTLYMQNADITVEELAFASKISERTIGAMRNKSDYRPKLQNLIAICIGMHLKPSYSYRLLETAGYRLTNTYSDTIYKYLLDNFYMYDVESCNKFLIKAKMKPL